MTARPRVVVVGLGPGPAELITAGTLDLLRDPQHCYARTSRHPSASVLAPSTVYFDDVYETATSLDEVYRQIVSRLATASETHREIMYAVPGSPVVAERTVELLAARRDLDVSIVPAMSFLDLAWARLAIDPIAQGVAVVDGQSFATDAAGRTGPLLIAQCDSVGILSNLKLAFDEPPCETVTVLHHLGLPDEAVYAVDWPILDRIAADHLTSLFIPSVRVPVAAAFARFDDLVRRLRAECPWDREQTHYTLRRHLLEEAYEVLDALDGLEAAAGSGELGEAYSHLEEELGDLLFQVFFHSVLAAEQGQFTVADVARSVHDKLRDRHPHVYGDAVAGTSEQVLANWEQIKKAEKNRSSVMDGIPRALPALVYALKVQKKAESAGYVEPSEYDDRDIGERLFALVSIARSAGVDPEDALRRAADRFRSRFATHEHAPRESAG